jgi:hypothetical protein
MGKRCRDSRHRLLIKLEQAETEIDFLHKNNTFKLQRTLDRHNARLKLNYCLLPDPPHYRYYLPLKGLSHEIDFKNFDKNLQNLT